MLSHQSLLLLQSGFLLQLPETNTIHTFYIQKSFRLAAWKISGKDYKVRDFLRRCPTFSSLRRGTARPYENAWGLWSGWCDSKQIVVFQHLSKTSQHTWHSFSMRSSVSHNQGLQVFNRCVPHAHRWRHIIEPNRTYYCPKK